jgi:hypothetical protein
MNLQRLIPTTTTTTATYCKDATVLVTGTGTTVVTGTGIRVRVRVQCRVRKRQSDPGGIHTAYSYLVVVLVKRKTCAQRRPRRRACPSTNTKNTNVVVLWSSIIV